MSLAVVGAGAWGTALAQMLAAEGTPVLLWARNPALAEAINRDRANEPYLPGCPLSPAIRATADLDEAGEAGTLLAVTPAQAMRSVLSRLGPRRRRVVLCCKGIERGTGLLMHQAAAEACPGASVAILSGPTFAHEVARGQPTAVTLAHADEGEAQAIAALIARPAFRPYISTDCIGAEIGGAVKNVLAIACGVVEGLGLGQNARAALISRGFAEMVRFGVARGAHLSTLAGMSGLGDLVLTCSSTASRNYSLGRGLGEGMTPAELLLGRRTVAEGAATAPVLVEEAARAGVDMPIAEAVARMLEGEPARVAAAALLARPIKAEAG